MTTDRHASGPLEIPEPLVWRTYRSMSAAGPWRILTYTERAEVVLTLHTGPATDPGAFPPVEVLSYTVDLLEGLDEQHRDARTVAARLEEEAAALPPAAAYLLRRHGADIATALHARHAVALRGVLDAKIVPLSEV
ncbi:MAG: hypothetical protein GY913_27295 [Proteobacteria bacterium]|nr:hypothetical protein [Pseudomonadota bacterium]